MSWKKRILLMLAVLMSLVAIFCTSGLYLFKAAPDWYVPRALTAEQQAAAAAQAERKVIETRNWAAEARAREQAKANNTLSSRAATRPFAPDTTIAFTADELNAFFQKWAPTAKWDPRVRNYV